MESNHLLLSYRARIDRFDNLVGKVGIEPTTSVLSGQRSATELLAPYGQSVSGGSGKRSAGELTTRVTKF